MENPAEYENYKNKVLQHMTEGVEAAGIKENEAAL